MRRGPMADKLLIHRNWRCNPASYPGFPPDIHRQGGSFPQSRARYPPVHPQFLYRMRVNPVARNRVRPNTRPQAARVLRSWRCRGNGSSYERKVFGQQELLGLALLGSQGSSESQLSGPLGLRTGWSGRRQECPQGHDAMTSASAHLTPPLIFYSQHRQLHEKDPARLSTGRAFPPSVRDASSASCTCGTDSRRRRRNRQPDIVARCGTIPNLWGHALYLAMPVPRSDCHLPINLV